MARTIFLILLLLNLVVLAWVYAKGDARINAGREPQRVAAQMEVDKVRIVSLAMAESSLSAVAVETVSATSISATATTTAVSATAAVAGEACHGYSGATVKEAQQIAQTLAAKLPGARIVANPIALPGSFDIAIAGLASRSAADTRLAELKKQGIKDGARIREEDDKRFSLVIASFPDRSAAEEGLKVIGKKGVTTATLVERKTAPEKALIEVRGSESALKKLPEQIAAFKTLSATACMAQ